MGCVFNGIGGLPIDHRKVGASAQPKDSHCRHRNTRGHGRLHKGSLGVSHQMTMFMSGRDEGGARINHRCHPFYIFIFR